jgi:hypothetical protein
MQRARRHQGASAGLAFALLALVAELTGRSLTIRLDLGRHVGTPSYADAGYYPFLLAGVKVAVALMLARLAWRFARARSSARAARRLLAAVGSAPATRVPRVRLQISPRLWALSFAATSLFFLVQVHLEGIPAGRWPLLAPWLHGTALPVFAVLSVLVALLYGAVARWLADYESYAEANVAYARALARIAPVLPVRRAFADVEPPRRLFGLAFQVRPPPGPA